MQTLQQTLVEERDKILQNANQQRSMLEESLHSTKGEEQRLRTKLAEAEEVGVLVGLFSVFRQVDQNDCPLLSTRFQGTRTDSDGIKDRVMTRAICLF